MATNVAKAVLLASPVLRDMDITEEDAHQKVPEALKGMGIVATLEELLAWVGGRIPEQREEAERALAAAEMLGLTEVVNGLALDGPPVTLRRDLVCHNLERQALVRAWALGYRLVYDGIIDFFVDTALLLLALRNGMDPIELSGNNTLTDEHLSYCTRLEVLDLCMSTRVTRCPVTVVDFKCGCSCEIGDDGFAGCDRLKRFDAGGNPRITRCPPTVTDLVASEGSEIGTESILQCASLKRLSVAANWFITRIPPFVESVSATITGAMSFQSISENRHIRELYIGDNDNFAEIPENLYDTLEVLDLTLIDDRHDGKIIRVGDECISKLRRLKSLNVTGRADITVCPPTVEILTVSNVSSITERTIAKCKGLHTLSIGTCTKIMELPLSVTTLTVGNGVDHSLDTRRIVGGSVRKLTVINAVIAGDLPETLEELELVSGSIEKGSLSRCRSLRKMTVEDRRVVLDDLPPNLEEISVKTDDPTILSLISSCLSLRKLTLETKVNIGTLPSSLEELTLYDFRGIRDEVLDACPSLKRVTLMKSSSIDMSRPIPQHRLIRMAYNAKPLPAAFGITYGSTPFMNFFSTAPRTSDTPAESEEAEPENGRSVVFHMFDAAGPDMNLQRRVIQKFANCVFVQSLACSVIVLPSAERLGENEHLLELESSVKPLPSTREGTELKNLLTNPASFCQIAAVGAALKKLRDLRDPETIDTILRWDSARNGAFLQRAFAKIVIETSDPHLREVTRRFWGDYLDKHAGARRSDLPIPTSLLAIGGFTAEEVAPLLEAIRNTSDSAIRALLD